MGYKHTVLGVDDEADKRQVLVVARQRAGDDVDAAEDGVAEFPSSARGGREL
ncbi:MAG: hypothetical protein H0W76_23390 [Pyrinomonadaceae bacterium]|nr:hypothetical protein [Pyrinomonadaceae bacterium]